MKELLLGGVFIVFSIYGFYLMKKIDHFLKNL